MRIQNAIATLLVIISIVLLIPGLTLPMISISFAAKVDAGLAAMNGNVFDETRSILGTVETLIDRDRLLVGALIFLFSVVVPAAKSILMLWAINANNQLVRKKIVELMNVIGKWSMADVFVVAIFLVFLDTDQDQRAQTQQVNIMGLSLAVKVTTVMVSKVGTGFYCFLSYCLVSVFSTYFVKYKID